MKLPSVTIKQLLEAGVHLGHKTFRWNPKMDKFIFGSKDSIHIIDLVQISDSMADDLNYYYLFDFNLDHEINGSDIFALATYILGF